MKKLDEIRCRKEFGGAAHGWDVWNHVIATDGEYAIVHTCYDKLPNDVFRGNMYRQPNAGGKWPGGYYYYGFIYCIWH